MPNTVTSPNMNIITPVTGVEVGPAWASELQAALFSTIDAHDHSSGKGVQVTPAGLNINADLAFGSNNGTALRSARFTQQASPLALGPDVGCLYDVLGDAYWNNASGTAIQLTKNGAVNAQFQSLNTKTNVTGTYTVLSTDTFGQYFVNSAAPVTINLPAASAKPLGTVYEFVDVTGSTESNIVTFVPNGTDNINGANVNLVWAQNRGRLIFTGDGASNWYVTYAGLAEVVSTGLSVRAPASAATNPVSMTLAPQPPNAGAGSTSTGTPGSLFINYAAPVSTGAEAGVKVQRAGTTQLRVGNVSSFPAVHLGSSGDAPTVSNYHLLTSDGVTLFINSAGLVNLAISNAVQVALSAGTLNFPPGTMTLQSNGTSVAAVTSGGLAITNSSGPTITSGTGAPATTPPNGSLYLRTDGSASTMIYERAAGVWQPIQVSLGAPVVVTERTITANYTVDASGSDYLILCNAAGAITVTLPAPTTGREVVIKDISGAASTNKITLAQHASENIEGVAASRTLATNWGSWTIVSDGTNWYFLD